MKKGFVLLLLLLCLCGCMRQSTGTENSQAISSESPSEEAKPKELEGLHWTGAMELRYAKEFSVDYYEDDEGKKYKLLSTRGGTEYLLPEGEEPSKIYLAATACMDMFRSIDGIGKLRFSSLRAEGWRIPEAVSAMERGDLLFAGKYSAPDFELLLSEGCDLAIENTMIFHSPETLEKIESLGIPVIVEYSSYEEHPLGRVEWVKFFGALLSKEELAEKIFSEQEEAMKAAESEADSGRTVAYFYLSSTGAVNVRKSGDYIPKMIELAGGRYIFSDLGDPESHSSSMNMQMEEFYARAKDADYLVYNGTINGEIKTISDLIAANPLFQDFKAVQQGHVFYASKDVYQQSMSLGDMILDFHRMMESEFGEMKLLKKMEEL